MLRIVSMDRLRRTLHLKLESSKKQKQQCACERRGCFIDHLMPRLTIAILFY